MKRSSRSVVALGIAAATATLALAGCGSGGASSSMSTAPASAPSTSSAAAPKPTAKAQSTTRPASQHQEVPETDWPFFGRTPQRTQYLAEPVKDLRPPFKVAWTFNTHSLIEFPPAIHAGVAYLVNKYGNTEGLRLRDRKVLWRHVTERHPHGSPLDVTGPAYSAGHVYYAGLGGLLFSLDARTGQVTWVRNLHAHLESSPLIVGKSIYIGTDGDQLLALRTSDGRARWSLDVPGAIKASPSYQDGHVFVADYQSTMFAVDARTGKPIWHTNTSTQAPYGKGGFYSSPAISGGRVFAARDDGTVFAFDEKTGKVDWSFPTGALTYGSPAVAQVPGTKATVYIGAENGIFYALDAHNGTELWHHDLGGPIPGTATVVADTVFTSSFKLRKAIGFNVRTHKPDFSISTAGYTPLVSDGRRLFVTGYYTFIALKPAGRSAPKK
jgi:outer membrane protein assembly factor BamB